MRAAQEFTSIGLAYALKALGWVAAFMEPTLVFKV